MNKSELVAKLEELSKLFNNISDDVRSAVHRIDLAKNAAIYDPSNYGLNKEIKDSIKILDELSNLLNKSKSITLASTKVVEETLSLKFQLAERFPELKRA